MPVPPPRSGDPYLARIAAMVNAAAFRLDPLILGLRNDGTRVHIRFRAPFDAPWVRIHVQSDRPSEGGLAYDPNHASPVTVTLE